MKIEFWRNATLVLIVNNTRILVDPMLGEKGSLGIFPMTDNELLNPLVDLPFDNQTLLEKLKKVDAVAVSHLHPDHWDVKAIELLDKNIPVFCSSVIAEQISQYGFKNTIPIEEKITWNAIDISLTKGRHGTGEIGEKMGLVNGFIFKSADKTTYIVGDSIWCSEVAEAINTYQPQNIIVAGGAATFNVGDPIIMNTKDIINTCRYAPKASVWITHLETVSHCKEDRKFTRKKIKENNLQDQCFILNDGEEVNI
ncbi:MBL fold metallo-hydrolase [Chryseobacterium paridis]|uniref:MBL fold metallo-hydrolase n=1 Tax=Chryseobacterium paridis TaxID=2800328 RepID=A0ABS1FW12_9FLAO|nr:MBL fold metallo-hydrolase [Chryseobacterium paridis]MBK1896602.1 MBL fold metallo-hydrolase [Chryseobacterium paridis]